MNVDVFTLWGKLSNPKGVSIETRQSEALGLVFRKVMVRGVVEVAPPESVHQEDRDDHEAQEEAQEEGQQEPEARRSHHHRPGGRGVRVRGLHLLLSLCNGEN